MLIAILNCCTKEELEEEEETPMAITPESVEEGMLLFHTCGEDMSTNCRCRRRGDIDGAQAGYQEQDSSCGAYVESIRTPAVGQYSVDVGPNGRLSTDDVDD